MSCRKKSVSVGTRQIPYLRLPIFKPVTPRGENSRKRTSTLRREESKLLEDRKLVSIRAVEQNILRRKFELLKASICEVDIRVRVPVDGVEGQDVSKSHESLSVVCLAK
jgi:hypothetical protein